MIEMLLDSKNAEINAYQQIKRAIMLKRLLPGQKLSEEWISRNLNMSRTPVRAAFKKLEEERLVEIIPRRGAFVYEPTIKEIRDVFEVRIVLECYAAKKAASMISDQYISQLDELIEKEKEAYETRDFESFITINNSIHQTPAIVTQNKSLIKQINSLLNWSDCYIVLNDPFYNRSVDTAKNIPEHKKIVETLSNRNPLQAEKAVRTHLESTLNSLEEPKSIFDN